MKIEEKNRFCTVWQLGGSGRVQNTPTGCENDLPTRGTHFRKIFVLIIFGILPWSLAQTWHIAFGVIPLRITIADRRTQGRLAPCIPKYIH